MPTWFSILLRHLANAPGVPARDSSCPHAGTCIRMSKPPPAFWQDPEGDGEDVAPPEPEDDAATENAPDEDAAAEDAPDVDGSEADGVADR